MPDRIVVHPSAGVLPADTAVLRGDDRGVLNGDGVFETLHVRYGVPWLLDAHLNRMARSAILLDLDLPPRQALADLALRAGAEAGGDAESALRLICTRGPEDGPVTYWATLSPVPPGTVHERRNGVRVRTASLGVTATGRTGLPWLLTGAKSLSYATNLAARRWAAENSADDVLWTSTDGYALEAATANLVWLTEDTLCTVPAADTGILPGITADHLLAVSGWRSAERMVTPQQLTTTDGVWLTSSLRGLAEVRTLDGTELPPSPWTSRLLDQLGHPKSAD